MIALFVGGTLVLCAGVFAIVFGIPIKDFSVGNTLIQSGVMVSATGVLLIGFGLVVRELRLIGRRIEFGLASGRMTSVLPEAALPASVAAPEEPVRPQRPARPPGNGEFLFPRDEPLESPSLEELDAPLPPLPPLQPAPQQSADEEQPPMERPARPLSPRESALREPVTPREPAQRELRPRVRPQPQPVPRPDADAGEEGDTPRRDFLFSSRRRPSPPDAPSQPAPFTSRTAAGKADKNDAPASIEPPLFDSAWPPAVTPVPEPEAVPEPRPLRPRPPQQQAQPQPPRIPPQRRVEETEVTVIKSGIVDTMAYSLYSDGSIEAQLPEGTVRFESIDELRAHLDQRGM